MLLGILQDFAVGAKILDDGHKLKMELSTLIATLFG
jgi:hypothetical protein